MIRLAPDNFTPLTRTPWAGAGLAKSIKKSVVSDQNTLIGESWEVSCDATFPSMCIDMDMTLQSYIDTEPKKILGTAYKNDAGATCEVLVKLLNTSAPLSLQIHPDDDDPDLKPDECGKPESWYILDAEKSAGVYLGFNKKVSHSELKGAFSSSKAKDILQFVEVKPGDYFEIAPGVPHAIGAGVTLLEPQRILKGRSGKTFRLWDWDRKYNANGVEDSHGLPRELHLGEALKLIDVENCFGPQFVESLRREAELSEIGPNLLKNAFPANPYYQVTVYTASSPTSLNIGAQDCFSLVVPLSASLTLGDQTVQVGHPIFLPAGSEALADAKVTSRGDFAVISPSV